MPCKLIGRCGILTGIGMCVKPEENVVRADPENLGCSSVPLSEESQFSFVAADNCSLALQRGFYFSLRMPDWAKEFKAQTQKILAHGFEPLKANSKSKDSKQSMDNRSDRYGIIFSESTSANFFGDIPREMQVPQRTNSQRPVRSPKIKDDLTCGKRVSP
ncbi:uncharacterized protein LOC108051237 [Drosophila rhopaloa]|uniref:Uncharacterized protein LOC108051237 n=1 Tax=Drosophila rhopaloa TaxID=1041015 RepID=A0A6P4FMN7_DRORH|nr:uncharacterized protein LOC108051237 [Drosophila rhopaloa]